MRQLAATISFALVPALAGALVIFSMLCIVQTVTTAQSPLTPPHGRDMAVSVETLPPMKELTGDVIPRIACQIAPDKHGVPHISVGTGSFIGPNLVMTAGHVVEGTMFCLANGHPAKIVRDYHDLDIAFLEAANPSGAYAPISCDGIKTGEEYQTSGYADGDGYRRTAIWQGLDGLVVNTGENFDGMARF